MRGADWLCPRATPTEPGLRGSWGGAGSGKTSGGCWEGKRPFLISPPKHCLCPGSFCLVVCRKEGQAGGCPVRWLLDSLQEEQEKEAAGETGECGEHMCLPQRKGVPSPLRAFHFFPPSLAGFMHLCSRFSELLWNTT